MQEKRTPARVFPAGEYLKDELEARGLSQVELAEIMDKPVSVVNEILSAKRGITPDTAQALADALGVSAQFWLNLESAYRLWLLPKNDTVSRRAALYEKAPVRLMIRRGWIIDRPTIDGLEAEVSAFMGEESFAYAARKSTSYEEPTPAIQRAWLRRAFQLAPSVQTMGTFSRDRMPELIGQLRSLMEEPENVAHVPRLLAEYGIRFLMIEALPGSKIDGATFWMDNDKIPVIVLSLRYDRIDHFWFTLMHEIAHIWYGHGMCLDQDIVDGRPDVQTEPEELANSFASAALIPHEALADFVIRVRPLFSATRIQNFARTMRVHAGLVVGQLQHSHEVGYGNLRRMLVPVRNIITRTALTDGWGAQLPSNFR